MEVLLVIVTLIPWVPKCVSNLTLQTSRRFWQQCHCLHSSERPLKLLIWFHTWSFALLSDYTPVHPPPTLTSGVFNVYNGIDTVSFHLVEPENYGFHTKFYQFSSFYDFPPFAPLIIILEVLGLSSCFYNASIHSSDPENYRFHTKLYHFASCHLLSTTYMRPLSNLHPYPWGAKFNILLNGTMCSLNWNQNIFVVFLVSWLFHITEKWQKW